MAIGLCLSQFLVLVPMTLAELRRVVSVRRTFDGSLHGILPQMGAGTEKILREDYDTLQKVKKGSHPFITSVKMWAWWYLPLTGFFGSLAYFGLGMQRDKWLNRLSYFMVYQFTTYTVGVLACMKIALQTAMSLVQTKVSLLKSCLKSELQSAQDMDEETWSVSIAEPCKCLIDAMETLSTEFAKGLILDMAYKLSSFTLCFCLLLSPSRQEIAERTGKPWMDLFSMGFLIVWMIGSVVSACLALVGPAKLSTAW